MIKINESFSDDIEILQKVKNSEFESINIAELRLDAEEISHSTEITELISFDEIKGNLEYHLPHQTEGALKILRDLNGTALLADEVGLGKTITAGIMLKEGIVRGFLKKALILTPPSLVDQWVSELKEKFRIDAKIIEKESDWENPGIVIASLDRVKTFRRDEGRFRHAIAHNIEWDMLIVDEAHKLKDKGSRRWMFVDRIKKKRFMILTATPFQNDLIELYNLLHLLKRGHLGTINEFKKQFFHRGNKRHPLNPLELRRRLNEVMVRRRRDETIVKYTKRIPSIVAIDLSSEEKEIYDSINDLLKTKYFSAAGREINGRLIIFALLPKVTSSSRSAMESLTGIANNEKFHEKTREIAKGIVERLTNLKKDSKIEKLVSIVKEIFERDKEAKILIYTRHPTTLRYIAEKLHELNLSTVEYLGGLNREEKSRIVSKFKNEAQIMLSTETGSEGLNFQFCSNLINYDLPWNPMAVEQRIGRLDRIGQKKDMNIYSLATRGTMEEKVVDLIINKMCCIGLVIGELPIILFNLGLDGKGDSGLTNIEEMIMDAFIDSKNNLDKFSKKIDKISDLIQDGIDEYSKAKSYTGSVLSESGNNN